mgnify:FL=1
MNVENAYALSLDQIIVLLCTIGHKRTTLVQGHMGCGKSSLLQMLAEKFPKHIACYFDCTTKDLGDITIPNIAKLDDGTGYVTYLTNEELGAHHNAPVIIMVDEYGKANPAVKLALLRLMLERKIGSYTLHPESIVFATTNLGAENVGDFIPAHGRNRLTVVRCKKPNNLEWISDFGIPNGLDPSIMGWVKDNPQLMYGFEDVPNPSDNPYIFHPMEERAAFVTPRSLHAASDILLGRANMDDHTLTGSLIGTIGSRAATDLMAFVKIGDQLPSLESIKNDPENAKVPTSTSAVCMVVYRTLSAMSREWVDAWMDYLVRLDKEAQGMFVNGVRHAKYTHRKVVMTNAKFTKWCVENNHLFSADKM